VWGPELRFVAPPRPGIVTRIPPLPAFARATRWAMKALPPRLLRPLLMSFVTTFLAPSGRLLSEGGILVNARGERFCEETRAPEIPVSRQPGRRAFILLDGAIAERFEAWPNHVSTAPGVGYAFLSDYRRNRRDITLTAPTPEALAKKAGLPPDALASTLAHYNASEAERGGRPPLATPPYTLLGPLKSFICFTDGGLKVNESLQVLAVDGTPIPGLFAAGSAGQGGLLLEGHGHHLGWAFVSGRIAGHSAALAAEEAAGGGRAGGEPAPGDREGVACTR
jgi:fumarate reductase flavoprotein subunit